MTEREAHEPREIVGLREITTARELLELVAEVERGRAGAAARVRKAPLCAECGVDVCDGHGRPLSDAELYEDGFTAEPDGPTPLALTAPIDAFDPVDPLEEPAWADADPEAAEIARHVGLLLTLAREVRACPHCPIALDGLCFTHCAALRAALR
ncbi:hypothetical protein EDD29_2059 [Actinocorallia herbida]|uniref:Uncharacterized protein n=1 Tax=Actinocorallia herbida TaxID=58109 RepID=A0A3N1CT94_9ACTN|nr:hypothetical protein [Actinocorallia herbida]ROO84532.1 hypothetical protein EDD29_2059 [Actinocorallia herbida]